MKQTKHIQSIALSHQLASISPSAPQLCFQRGACMHACMHACMRGGNTCLGKAKHNMLNSESDGGRNQIIHDQGRPEHVILGCSMLFAEARMKSEYFLKGCSRVTQQTSLLCHTADMSAVSHSRHVGCVTQQTCLPCHTTDMSAV